MVWDNVKSDTVLRWGKVKNSTVNESDFKHRNLHVKCLVEKKTNVLVFGFKSWEGARVPLYIERRMEAKIYRNDFK